MDSPNTLTRPIAATRRRRGKSGPISYERMAILIAISSGLIRRAQLAEQVMADTIGVIVLRKSTVYSLIRELAVSQYIEDNEPIRLIDKGWRTLRHELGRIEQQRRLLKIRLHA